uniref:Response regulatory domain-containing protein n=1 Tax=Cyclophora tenuis TaxID=216820 RepID=A0A7S1D001_CYCTE|mmetsp:Transcript_14723/g.24951  ORF Transcript_14723/g.24951 Transcript_14723/m.24951 type:complete len:490 (+) Transcript_14723:1-1470(+)
MKRMNGFQAGPPMAAIGALDVFAHNLSNEECFRIRRDEQMKTILQWMESNRAARQNGRDARGFSTQDQQQYLTPDFVSSINEVHGTPSQNAYLRMLGWLSRIPFDEDELTSLRKYFYDSDGGEGDRGSDGYINLKLRGDLLAALDSGIADEIRETIPVFEGDYRGSVGLDLDHLKGGSSRWETLRGNFTERMPSSELEAEEGYRERDEAGDARDLGKEDNGPPQHSDKEYVFHMEQQHHNSVQSMHSESYSAQSKQSLQSESERSNASGAGERRTKMKPRITMFPAFEAKLEELKATAKEMMDYEDDPEQQDIILTQYAEASLTILRQLKYHCMHSGLDGWRQGGLRRKVLIVDDSLVTRKMVSRAFEKANFIVDTAENGVEGVMKLKKAIYDIAFMDIDMPVMNGFEATKALRQWEDTHRPGARQPICALTAAYVDDFERSELMKFKEAGLDVMESKPCNIPRLFKVVDDVSPMFSDLSISVSQASTS